MASSKKKQPAPTGPRFDPKEWLNVDQYEAYRLATTQGNKYHLFYGPAGSGKSWLIILIMVARAMRAPKSRHVVFRLTRSSCEETLFKKTFVEVMTTVFPTVWAELQKNNAINYSNMVVTFGNEATIKFDGLDEHRATKVLGNEFNTVFINECNEDGLTYKSISTLMGRQRTNIKTLDGTILKNKMFFDCNPRFYSDWEYKAFIEQVNPVDGNAMPRPERWVSMKLRTHANLKNLSEDYLETFDNMSSAERRRYADGEWSSENNNALFTDQMFVGAREPKPQHVITPAETLAMLEERGIELDRVTIAADPAVTADPKSDLTGITVQGITVHEDGTEHAYVLADYSDRYRPDAACQVISKACKEWGASRVIMEKNQGGLWLESTLRKHHPHIPLKFVSATATTGGKRSRAEPVAAQYERGVVHHVGAFKDLEYEMCDFGSPASRKKSPDRMDALVWGLTELFDLGAEKKRKKGGMVFRSRYAR